MAAAADWLRWATVADDFDRGRVARLMIHEDWIRAAWLPGRVAASCMQLKLFNLFYA